MSIYCFKYLYLRVIISFSSRASRCRMRYSLRDANHQHTLGIIGPRCICDGEYSCCCDNEFAVNIIFINNKKQR